MGGKSGGSQRNVTTTQTSTPPAWALPLFKQSADDASYMYNAGKGGNVYHGQRLADPNQNTLNTIDEIGALGSYFYRPELQNILNNGTSTGKNLVQIAQGKPMGENQVFNHMLQNTLDDTASKINAQFSGAGRYGSGAHNELLGNSLGKVATLAKASQYNQDVDAMLRANHLIDSHNHSLLGAAGNLLDQQASLLENKLHANTMLDQHAQNKLNTAWEKWSEEDNREWNRIKYLQDTAHGAAQTYGTQASTNISNEFTPWGFNAGRFMRGLIKSDLNAKDNIRFVGYKNKFRLYEFNYIGSKERFRGVIAQDLLTTHPEALSIDPKDKLYCVDYDQLNINIERIDTTRPLCQHASKFLPSFTGVA